MEQIKSFALSKALQELYNLGRRKASKYLYQKQKRKVARLMNGRELVLSGFPAHQTVKLKYVTHFKMDPGAGTLVNHTFRPGSLYRPEVTGAPTRQPMGHDQWSVVYTKYIVLSAKIKVTTASIVSTAVIPAVWGILLSTNVTNEYTDYRDIMEARTGSRRVNHYGVASNNPANGRLKDSSLSKSYRPKSFFGLSNVLDNEDLQGDTEHTLGSNPNSQAYFHVWAQSPDQVTDPGSQNFVATMEFIAMYRDPSLLPAS